METFPQANKSEELILWKWLYYQRWYTDSMQSQHQDSIPIHRIDSNFISFQRNRKGNLRIHIWNTINLGHLKSPHTKE